MWCWKQIEKFKKVCCPVLCQWCMCYDLYNLNKCTFGIQIHVCSYHELEKLCTFLHNFKCVSICFCKNNVYPWHMHFSNSVAIVDWCYIIMLLLHECLFLFIFFVTVQWPISPKSLSWQSKYKGLSVHHTHIYMMIVSRNSLYICKECDISHHKFYSCQFSVIQSHNLHLVYIRS